MPASDKQNLRIALGGAKGRMGSEIAALAESQGATITCSVEREDDWVKCTPDQVDVVIDFSSPEGFKQALAWAFRHRRPFVSGTTGLEVKAPLVSAAAEIPVLYSANMSVGVAVFTAMLRELRGVKDWDFQIEEAHHSQKKDSPSGTALLLQHHLEVAIGRKVAPPLAIRGGGIPGIHQVFAMGPDETLQIQHTAFNRKVFAHGALRAARWLFDKKQPGLYDLTDLYKKP